MTEINYVDHPPHYQSNGSGIEVIDATEQMGFNLGNAYKYVARFEKKFDPIEDLKKARWYVKRELDKRASPKPMVTNTLAQAFADAEIDDIKRACLISIAELQYGGFVTWSTYSQTLYLIDLLIEREERKACKSAHPASGGHEEVPHRLTD